LFPPSLTDAAVALLNDLRNRGLKLATAESCTGGLIAGLLTEIAGSSDVVERGFVTYSNAAKAELLGVPGAMLAGHGAVSEAVARAMAQGALTRSHADIAVAVTGVAGPGGGTAAKPVGLVHVAAARRGGQVLHRECRFGDIGRGAVRIASMEAALQLAARVAEASPAP
jgi:nicotinamide-nucleotide amidase